MQQRLLSPLIQPLAAALFNRVGSGAPTPPAAITTAEILGPTPELDGINATDASQTPPLYGVVPDGWVLKLTMPYLVGQTPVATKIHLLVRDTSKDENDNNITVTRYLTGSVRIRSQCKTTGTYVKTFLDTNDGTTLTTYVALNHDPDALRLLELAGDTVCYGDDVIYSTTTIVSLTVESGFYGAAQSGTFSGSVTNSSARTYSKAEVGYLNVPGEVVGATRTGEVVAAYILGQQGRMARGIRVRGRDSAGNTTAWTVVTTPTLSAIQTNGNRVECFAYSYSTTALTQGLVCRDEVEVIPWIGDATAKTLSEDYWANSVQDPRRAPKWVCDRTGAYGGAIAIVDPVNGTAGGAIAASLGAAVAYQTLDQAGDAAATYNTGKGHTDTGGLNIYLYTAAGDVSLVQGGNIGNTSGEGRVLVQQHPSNTGVVSIDLTGLRTIPTNWQFSGVPFIKSVTAGGWSGGVTTLTGEGHWIIIDSCTVALNAGTTNGWCQVTNRVYLRNVQYTTGQGVALNNVAAMGTNGANVFACMLALGVTTNFTNNVTAVPYRLLGCLFHGGPGDRNVNQPSNDGLMVMNCTFRSQGAMTIGKQDSAANVLNFSRGIYFVQNSVTFYAAGGTSQGLVISGDSCVGNIDNVLIAYISSSHNIGNTSDDTGKCNAAYVDVAAAVNKIRRDVRRFCIFPRSAIKGDDFDNVAEGFARVGNWEGRHKGRWMGNVLMIDRNPETGTGVSPTWWGEIIERYGKVNAGFAMHRDPQGGTGTGISDLRLTTATNNAARGTIPVNCGMLKYDLGGSARADDAAGCYEWAP